MKAKNKINPSILLEVKKLLIAFFIVVSGIYVFSSNGRTPFDYFSRLSDALLAGKLSVTHSNLWLSELIPAGTGKYFVAYPPMPAILAMPFRLVLRDIFAQDYLAHLLGAGIVVLTMAVSWHVKRDKKLMIWSGLLTGLGTIIWFLSSVGSAWYVGQLTSAFFLTAAICSTLYKKKPASYRNFNRGGIALKTTYNSITPSLSISPKWQKPP